MAVAKNGEEMSAISDALAVLGAALVAFLGFYLTLFSQDPVMSFHGAVLGVAAVGSAIWVLSSLSGDAGASYYNDGPIKFAAIASVFWGIAGFLVGATIAWQLAYPALNFDLPWTSFGRLRPLHTSAVIFAFGGNALLATSFYVVQRTCKARLFGRWSPWFVVLGYNLFIVIAGTGYILGVTQSKEYAEPEWYADLWLTIVWVV